MRYVRSLLTVCVAFLYFSSVTGDDECPNCAEFAEFLKKVKSQQSDSDVRLPQSDLDVRFPQSDLDLRFPQSELDETLPQSDLDVRIPQPDLDVRIPQFDLDEQEVVVNHSRSHYYYSIIPGAAIVLLCRLCLRCSCKQKKKGISYENLQEVAVTDASQTMVPAASESVQPVVPPASLPSFDSSGCVSSPPPTGGDKPPSYSEACAVQPPNNQFYK